MSDTPPSAPFRYPAQLRNGTAVLVRAIRSDDRQRIIDAFHKLEPQTVYSRFFAVKKELSEADLSRIDAADCVHAVALVATIGQGDDETIIGAGGYTVLDERAPQRVAEVSFTVEEDYHGQGLAGLFMRLLTQIGRERGIQRFEAEVLADNQPMLKVFERCGLPVQVVFEEGVVHVVMELAPVAAG